MKKLLVSFAALKLHRSYCPIYIYIYYCHRGISCWHQKKRSYSSMDESANWYQNIWTHSTIHSIKDLPSQIDLKRITAQHLRPYKSSQQNYILFNQTKQELQNYFRNWEYINRWGFSILPIENQPMTSSVTHHPKNKHLHNILCHNATHRIKLQYSSTNHNSSH